MSSQQRPSADASPGASDVQIAFSGLDGDDGVGVVDPIERQRYALYTAGPVAPRRTDPDRLAVPVDAAVAMTTDAVTLPTVVPVYVRDADGRMRAEAEHFADRTLPSGRHLLEICAAIKLYVRVEGGVHVASDASRMRLSFDGADEVVVGARSHHEHPAATVTTTADPVDVLAAVSTFGSALKTTSPERSYPTLRGHPPLVELGDSLSVPAGLEPPETGVRLVVPPTYRHAYVAAPLAYYLGAEAVPGEEPRIETDRGLAQPLSGPQGYEVAVERVLKQVFFLDCLTRTEGITAVDLHERDVLEDDLDLAFASLYGQPPADRLAAYLGVPFETVAPELPDWKVTTHVAPTPESVETLPFLVDDLAVVRTPVDPEVAGPVQEPAAVADFLRDGEFVRRSAAGESPGTDAGLSYVRPGSTDSLEQTWIGDGTPVGASKATPEAYRNRLARGPVEGDVEIAVVCNDAEMDDERTVVDDVYGSRGTLPFDVTVSRGLTTGELAARLADDADFLHYIGHIDAEGFECADGRLDIRSLSTVGVEAFFLNACQSYDQGMALIEAGAIGGIVTLEDVINSGAVRIGSTIARLLNGGFPLRAALEVAKEESVVGRQYLVVGDGGLGIAQPESRTPLVCDVEADGDAYEVTVETYPTSEGGMGSLFMPYAEGVDSYFLNSGSLEPIRMTGPELREFLRLENAPVRLDGELRWSGELLANGFGYGPK